MEQRAKASHAYGFHVAAAAAANSDAQERGGSQEVKRSGFNHSCPWLLDFLIFTLKNLLAAAAGGLAKGRGWGKQDFPCTATFAVFSFKPPAVYSRALGTRRLISAVQQVLVWKTLNPSGSEKDRMLSLILYVVLSAPPHPHPLWSSAEYGGPL